MSYWSPAPGSTPTHRELEVLAATLLLTRDEAASTLGIARRTVDQHLGNLDIRLQVHAHRQAAAAIGWLHIPDEYLPSTHRVDPPSPSWLLRRVAH